MNCSAVTEVDTDTDSDYPLDNVPIHYPTTLEPASAVFDCLTHLSLLMNDYLLHRMVGSILVLYSLSSQQPILLIKSLLQGIQKVFEINQRV